MNERRPDPQAGAPRRKANSAASIGSPPNPQRADTTDDFDWLREHPGSTEHRRPATPDELAIVVPATRLPHGHTVTGGTTIIRRLGRKFLIKRFELFLRGPDGHHCELDTCIEALVGRPTGRLS